MEERDLAGTTLGGRYIVLDLLGKGGMGAVYRAHDRELDEPVALKVIRPDLVHREGAVEQFRREVKLARRVTHVNIARTFELVVADDVMFCTMELVQGRSLRERLLRGGAMSIQEAVAIAHAMCEGLAVAHAAGVVHRDIKPDNVLVTEQGRVVIADFGVASLSISDDDGALVGTLEYMAPEQARGEHATPASDVYAVGVVLFEMLTGLRAFSGSMSELIVAKQDVERLSLDFAESIVREPIPPGLQAVIADATAREVGERIATARQLAERMAPWRPEVLEPTRLHHVQQMAAVGGVDADLDDPIDPPIDPPHPVTTVVVLAPRAAGDSSRLHLAEGVHQELLRRLSRNPEVRVWPRVEASALPGATFVELAAERELVVTIRRDDAVSTLRVPLDTANVALSADTIAAATLELTYRTPDREAEERLALLLEVRALVHAGFRGVPRAFERIREGYRRWPDDPRIVSELASLTMRYAFDSAIDDVESTRQLVMAALHGAPNLAEAHVAAAQFELHVGDPARAARAFRTAITCSPYLAEPHEGLGRMLLEAGFLDDALARIDDALAIAPQLSSVRWEIARAHALEDNWMIHDELIERLRRESDRPIARFRYAMWRDDRAGMVEARGGWTPTTNRFEPNLMKLMFGTVLDETWERDKSSLMDEVLGGPNKTKRRRAFLSQFLSEIAGRFGDVAACLELMTAAVDNDLFDLHWFERVRPIAAARDTPEGHRLHAIVKQRADSILDAMYGDAGLSVDPADTIVTVGPHEGSR